MQKWTWDRVGITMMLTFLFPIFIMAGISELSLNLMIIISDMRYAKKLRMLLEMGIFDRK